MTKQMEKLMPYKNKKDRKKPKKKKIDINNLPTAEDKARQDKLDSAGDDKIMRDMGISDAQRKQGIPDLLKKKLRRKDAAVVKKAKGGICNGKNSGKTVRGAGIARQGVRPAKMR